MKKTRYSHIPLRAAAALLLIVASGGAVHAGPGRRPQVAVLNFHAAGAAESAASIVRGYLEMELHRDGGLILLEREQVRRDYGMDEVDRYGCEDSSCAVLAGRAMSAEYVIFGDVVKKRAYTVSVKVVSIEKEKIVHSYAESYRGDGNAKKAAQKIARSIIADLVPSPVPADDRRSCDGRKRPESAIRIDVRAAPLLFQPLGVLQDLVNTGPGVSAGLSLSGFSWAGSGVPGGLTLGFDAGFTRLAGSINSSDSCILAPLMLMAGCRFGLGSGMYLLPGLSAGLVFVRFDHPGGDGFNMEDGSSRQTMDPCLRAAVMFGRDFSEWLSLEAAASYWMLVESSGPIHSISLQLGLSWHTIWQ
jgi:hypothetical protein